MKEWYEQILNIKEEITKEDPTIVMHHFVETDLSLSFDIYCKGIELFVTIKEEYEEIKIEVLNTEITIVEKTLKKTMETLLKKIENKQRLINLYEPPKYHFYNEIRKIIPKNIADQIHGELLKNYSWEEIEIYFCKNKKNKPLLNFGDYFLFEFMDILFLTDLEKLIKTYPKEKIEESFQEIEKLTVKNIKNAAK